MDVWKWEMDMCCSMQIESLYKKLLVCKEKGTMTGICLRANIPAAPMNESLFDNVMLFVESDEKDGKIVVTGKVHYWSPVKGSWNKTTEIRSFDSFDECLEWMENENVASKECAEILYERCK